MLHLTDDQIDRVIVHRHALLLAGVGVMTLPWLLPPGWGLGLFSGFMLFSLGVYGVVFRRWRTEPGLWMLAVLLTAFLGPALVFFEVTSLRGVLAGAAIRANDWEQARVAIDATMALVIFAFTVTWSIAVGAENWRRTRGDSGRRG